MIGSGKSPSVEVVQGRMGQGATRVPPRERKRPEGERGEVTRRLVQIEPLRPTESKRRAWNLENLVCVYAHVSREFAA